MPMDQSHHAFHNGCDDVPFAVALRSTANRSPVHELIDH